VARPITRAAAQQNREFLKVLRRTGNVRLAAREVGAKYGTMQHRRRVHPGFAVRWDAAVAFAQARLNSEKERQSFDKLRTSGEGRPLTPTPLPRGGEGLFRTVGGEPTLRRTRNGKLQMQRAQVGKLTPVAEQAFLAALSATCNVSLAAAAVGAAAHAFYRRRRQCPAFAREWRLALQAGYDRLEAALLESAVAGSHEHDDWRSNDPPAMPPVSPNQALQLMYLHQKEARLLAEPFPCRRRRGEWREVYNERLAQMAEERDRRALEEFEIAEAERHALGQPAWGPAGEDVRNRLGLGRRLRGDDANAFSLPDLAQVIGWSRADPDKAPHDPDTALFGGWRMEDLERWQDAERWGTFFEEDES